MCTFTWHNLWHWKRNNTHTQAHTIQMVLVMLSLTFIAVLPHSQINFWYLTTTYIILQVFCLHEDISLGLTNVVTIVTKHMAQWCLFQLSCDRVNTPGVHTRIWWSTQKVGVWWVWGLSTDRMCQEIIVSTEKQKKNRQKGQCLFSH